MDSVKASLAALESDYDVVKCNLGRMRMSLHVMQSELMPNGADRPRITLQSKEQVAFFANILSSPLSVAFYGPKGSGKCSLLNFFVGARIFPNAEGPKKSRIIEVHYATADNARLELWSLNDLLRAKSVGQASFDSADATSSAPSNGNLPAPSLVVSLADVARGKVFKEIEEHVVQPESEYGNDKWYQTIVRVYWPIEFGKMTSFVYLPGVVNGAASEMEDHVAVYITNTVLAGVAFCYDNATFSDAETNCHERLLRLLSAVEPALKPSVFYINTKFDAKSISPDRGSDAAALTQEDVERELDRCLEYLSTHMGISSELEFPRSAAECPYWSACSSNDYKQLAIMKANAASAGVKIWVHTNFTSKFFHWLFARVSVARHRTLLMQLAPVRTWFYYLLRKISALGDVEWTKFKSDGERQIDDLRRQVEQQFQAVMENVKRQVQSTLKDPNFVAEAKQKATEIVLLDPLTAEHVFHTAFSKFLIERLWRQPLRMARDKFSSLLQEITESAKRSSRTSNLLLHTALQSSSTASEDDLLPKPAARSHWWIVSQSLRLLGNMVTGKIAITDEWKVKRADTILQDPNLPAALKQVEKAIQQTLDSYFMPMLDTVRGRAAVGDEARKFFRANNSITSSMDKDFRFLDVNMWRTYASLNRVQYQQNLNLAPPTRGNPHLQRMMLAGVPVMLQSFPSLSDKPNILSEELYKALLVHTIVGSGDVAGSTMQPLGLNCHMLSTVPPGMPQFQAVREMCTEAVSDFAPFLVFADAPTLAEYTHLVCFSLEVATNCMISLSRLILVTHSMELLTPEFAPTNVFLIVKDGLPKNAVWLPSGSFLAPVPSDGDVKKIRSAALDASLDSLVGIAQALASLCVPEDGAELMLKWPRQSLEDLRLKLSLVD
mgnify:CR=1 FL=1